MGDIAIAGLKSVLADRGIMKKFDDAKARSTSTPAAESVDVYNFIGK
ncbi:hypothetical protein ACWF9G_22230 [Nocardia sp. NPDC055029]